MSIANVLTELWPSITQQQGQKVVAAFVSTQWTGPNAIPNGMTNAQFAELCLKRFIKGVVRGAERQTKEGELTTIFTQVDTDFPEA